MKKTKLAVVAVVGLVGSVGWAAAERASAKAPPPAPIPELSHGFSPGISDATRTAEQISFHEARSAGDPRAATDLAALASLYLQRSREGGGFEDYHRAEQAARQSLAIRVKQNSRAARMLAASLLAQHRFEEAYDVAKELVRVWPEEPAHRALLAELQMELGDYDAARATLATLEGERDNLSVAPRFARWAEVTGQREEERRILYAAADQAMYRSDLPREQVSWFFLRAAEHELRAGRLDAAEQAVRAGLRVEPGDIRLVSTLVRVELQRGRWQQAIAYGEMVGDAADLRTLGAIGDAHAALGQHSEAERYYRLLEESAAANPEPYNRQWTQFRLDHDRHIPETLAILQEEIKARRDVLGYDLLAWALFKSGDYQGARQAMSQALRMNTQDATLFYHAGMIEQALGAKAAARKHFKTALKLDPTMKRTLEAQTK